MFLLLFVVVIFGRCVFCVAMLHVRIIRGTGCFWNLLLASECELPTIRMHHTGRASCGCSHDALTCHTTRAPRPRTLQGGGAEEEDTYGQIASFNGNERSAHVNVGHSTEDM